MPIDIIQVEKLAGLAKLELNENERTRFVGELDSILSYVGILLDFKATTEPVFRAFAAELRSDEVVPFTDAALILQAVPRSQANLVEVPKVL